MKVNEKLRLLRESHQLTQEEMAGKLNMSLKGYAKIERGETRSNLPRLEQISEVFGMDVCELLSYGEDSKISLNHSDMNYSIISLGNANLELEIQKLQLTIAHKDEIIRFKDEMLEMQKQEILSLKAILKKDNR